MERMPMLPSEAASIGGGEMSDRNEMRPLYVALQEVIAPPTHTPPP